ncbi:conserved Plasmodium protein, unknown function [Plasmodium ovale wallikeri]|uniref:Uncharacterized protein n=2 Tax=Plasmodium ovale TaxID=36330 RepID=A0A1C3KT69_PLAOA|nr:conserved Plasmodium protein, unknown function [Plasmodium ovale wallikeri]SBT77347.1 conserved Plasmodium protein, unknown function [Plasmodium ovale]
MYLEREHTDVKHTKNRSKEKSSFEEMSNYVLKNSDTCEIKCIEKNDVHSGNIDGVIEDTNTNLNMNLMIKKYEKKNKLLDLNENEKLDLRDKKGKLLYYEMKDDTGCSSNFDDNTSCNDMEDVVENKPVSKIETLGVNTTLDPGINRIWNGKKTSTETVLTSSHVSNGGQEEEGKDTHLDEKEKIYPRRSNREKEKEKSKKEKQMKCSDYNKEKSTKKESGKSKKGSTIQPGKDNKDVKKKCKEIREIVGKTNENKEKMKGKVNRPKNTQLRSKAPLGEEMHEKETHEKEAHKEVTHKKEAHKEVTHKKETHKKETHKKETHKREIPEKGADNKCERGRSENYKENMTNGENKYKSKNSKRKISSINAINMYDTDSFGKEDRKKKKNYNPIDEEKALNEKKSSKGKNEKKEHNKNDKYNGEHDDSVCENEPKKGKSESVNRICNEECANEEDSYSENKSMKVSNERSKIKDRDIVVKEKNLSEQGNVMNTHIVVSGEEVSKITNENEDGYVKKKYARLLKNLQTNISSKKIEQECEKRIKTWGGKLTLQQKINYFIKNKIATRTEYKYGKKPNTLSICNQFNLYNHLTMLNDFNRLHYYRAAMRWTGYRDFYESKTSTLLGEEVNGTNSYYVKSLANTEKLCRINRNMNMHSIEKAKLNIKNDSNLMKNPYIFFESNKECYVYNKNIIEIGTGPLSLLSINAILNGAKHVDALEVNKDASEMAKKLIEGYNLEDFIKIINCYSKVYVYKEEESQKKLKRKNSFYNFFDYSSDEQYCNNFNYDLIISEVIGDFASQEGVADIYLDLHKKIFSYRKYQEYLNSFDANIGSDNPDVGNVSRGLRKYCEEDAEESSDHDKEENVNVHDENSFNKGRKLSYNEFAANEGLYNTEEFYHMNIKSIPYSVTTFYCPVKFPYSDNIIYKSVSYPERTIISPQNKLLQSVMLEWSNLTLTEEQNEDNNFGKLEYIYLEQNVINQVIQKRSHIFEIQKSGPFCGFLITIDVEIRKGEHFGTKYGTCDSWYTNIVLLKEEINVEKYDLIINKTYTNLLNYNENIIDRKTVLVSRPSYTFYGYILRLIKDNDSIFSSDSDDASYYDKNCVEEKEYKEHPSLSSTIHLDEETILLLDQMDFHEKIQPLNMKKENNGEEVRINDSLEVYKEEKIIKMQCDIEKDELNDLDGRHGKRKESHSPIGCELSTINSSSGKKDNTSRDMSHTNLANESTYPHENETNKNYPVGDVETKIGRDILKVRNEETKGKNSIKKSSNKMDRSLSEKKHNKDINTPPSNQNTKGKNTCEDRLNSAKVQNGNRQKSGEDPPKKSSKNYVNKKKKKDAQKNENKNKKMSEKSREEYEHDISNITNNFNLNSKFYYENLKGKVIVYKNMKYKLLSFYEPVVIDYDEQATVIYKKDDIYNSKENNVNKFVNNVYQ